jgi:hypothetical protein
LHYLLKLPVF